jgi:hypothetical protein
MGRWVRQNEKNKILRTENQPMSEPKKSRFRRDFHFLSDAVRRTLFAIRRLQTQLKKVISIESFTIHN